MVKGRIAIIKKYSRRTEYHTTFKYQAFNHCIVDLSTEDFVKNRVLDVVITDAQITSTSRININLYQVT